MHINQLKMILLRVIGNLKPGTPGTGISYVMESPQSIVSAKAINN
jgi:hypothetical protein